MRADTVQRGSALGLSISSQQHELSRLPALMIFSFVAIESWLRPEYAAFSRS
jgi:hypothetical protein